MHIHEENMPQHIVDSLITLILWMNVFDDDMTYIFQRELRTTHRAPFCFEAMQEKI